MNWSQKTWKSGFSRVNNCSNGKNGKIFCIASLLMMKSGYTTTQSEKSHGINPLMHQHPFGKAEYPWLQPYALYLVGSWQQGVVYYELLQSNETITVDRYRLRLMRLSRALKEKQPQYEQRQSNSPSRQCSISCRIGRQNKTLNWEILS